MLGRCLAQRCCHACSQEFEDKASPSAGARPSRPAHLKPQTTSFEEYDPAAFGQDVQPSWLPARSPTGVALGSSYQLQPASAEDVPAWAADGGEDPTVKQQRLALEQFQKLAMERKQV